jgi:hypothetical protein
MVQCLERKPSQAPIGHKIDSSLATTLAAPEICTNCFVVCAHLAGFEKNEYSFIWVIILNNPKCQM